MTPVVCAATGDGSVIDDILGDGNFPKSRRFSQKLKTTPPRAATPYRTPADEIPGLFPPSAPTSADMASVSVLDPIGHPPTSTSLMRGSLADLVKTTGRMTCEEVEAITDITPAPARDLAELLALEEGLRIPEYPGLNYQNQGDANKK